MQLTVLLVPLGAMIVRLLVKSPRAFALTLTLIIASDLAAMLVIIQVIFCPFWTSLINFAPLILIVFINSKPSGKLSITVKLFL